MLNFNIIPMGNNKKKKGKKKVVSAQGKPFVSVCTPTYNRRQFIPQLIKCFQQQNYPKQLMKRVVQKYKFLLMKLTNSIYLSLRIKENLTLKP